MPIKAAGCFAHEAVAWHKGILYETEDNGKPSGFYRWIPDRRPREFGDLATTGGPLQAMKRKDLATPYNADSAATGDEFEVEWVTIPNPDPPTNSVRTQGTALGMISFSRLEGCWVGDDKIYFDSTSGGPAGAGQVWEYDPREEKLRLVYQSTSTAVLQAPDNLVYVPHTGDVWLQEDGAGEQFVRGVTQDGEIYDFAKTIINDSEFCGGCFSPDGRTFFLNQQGGNGRHQPCRHRCQRRTDLRDLGPLRPRPRSRSRAPRRRLIHLRPLGGCSDSLERAAAPGRVVREADDVVVVDRPVHAVR